MNCKPGDLVRYVGPVPRPHGLGWIGRVVRYEPSGGAPVWVVAPPLPGGDIFWNGRVRLSGLAFDSSLRPIRDPGEDAECESKAWLPPVPNSTKETVNG